ncbi:Fic family protein [Mycoplasmopsis equigenitalium]|uniref:Fic family protein n=1 Tax=Mycoplasmopsis equigenitalium TaxID=114883 RepID=A0ABY5J2L9_9BACT|nr:Fic family protein [Mycoplasmopsis equigenitalium]UUD37245.1 Fic family protein [Mycoplasmopsis equigenitalium]
MHFEDVIKKLVANKEDDNFFVSKDLFNLRSQQELKNFAFNLEDICREENNLKLEKIKPEDILKRAIALNTKVFNNINELKDNAGILRTKKDMIVLTDEISNKQKSEPPLLLDYKGLLTDLDLMLTKPKHKLSKIILISSYLLKNQLFFNGNKRTTFFLTNQLLINNDLGPYFDRILADQQTSLASSKRLLDEWNIIPYINNIYKKYQGDKSDFSHDIRLDIDNFLQNNRFVNGAEFNPFLNRSKEEVTQYMEEVEAKNDEYETEITSLYKIR